MLKKTPISRQGSAFPHGKSSFANILNQVRKFQCHKDKKITRTAKYRKISQELQEAIEKGSELLNI